MGLFFRGCCRVSAVTDHAGSMIASHVIDLEHHVVILWHDRLDALMAAQTSIASLFCPSHTNLAHSYQE
jgi:hypothetical protein